MEDNYFLCSVTFLSLYSPGWPILSVTIRLDIGFLAYLTTRGKYNSKKIFCYGVKVRSMSFNWTPFFVEVSRSSCCFICHLRICWHFLISSPPPPPLFPYSSLKPTYLSILNIKGLSLFLKEDKTDSKPQKQAYLSGVYCDRQR